MSAGRTVAAARVIVAAWERGPSTADAAAEALEDAQLLQDPETAARAARMQDLLDRRSAQVEAMTEQVRALGADITAYRVRVAELEAAPTVIYRAEHVDSGITLGHYDTQAAARAHCEDAARTSHPLGDAVLTGWHGDELGPWDPWELVIEVGGPGDETVPAYTVTPLEVATSYTPEADQ